MKTTLPYTINEDYRLKKLAKYTKNCHSVLDVGCIQYPNPYLHNNYVEGLDYNKGVLPSNYTNFIQGDLSDLVNKGKTYNGIVAGEVLEHILNPIEFIQHCFQCLEPDGTLALSTPNPHSPIEFILTGTLNKRYFYTEDHIMLFPQRWLIRMLTVCGFKDISLHSGGFPLPPLGLIPFPRLFCHQTIAVAKKPKKT